MNCIGDGIMRKNQLNAALTETEIRRNKNISKARYKIEQYFGITHKYHGIVDGRYPSNKSIVFLIFRNNSSLFQILIFSFVKIARQKPFNIFQSN